MSQSAPPAIFNFNSHSVRVVMRDGEPWFVCSDVADALNYRDAEVAARHLGAHQKADTPIRCTSSNGTEQARTVTIINESGLYRLVLRSRKPEALAFSDWVTGEVLPSIRKTGGYALHSTIHPPEWDRPRDACAPRDSSGDHLGLPRSIRTTMKLVQSLKVWVSLNLDGKARDDLWELVNEIELLLHTCLTEVAESLIHIGIATRFLQRWQGIVPLAVNAPHRNAVAGKSPNRATRK